MASIKISILKGFANLTSESRDIPKHSLVIYEFSTGNERKVLRIWSFLKIGLRPKAIHRNLKVQDGSLIQFETGQTMYFKDGRVRLDNRELGEISGNYILYPEGLKQGFIRTFD